MSCDVTKLEYLNETKQMLREKIDPEGKKITDEMPFRDYVNYVATGEFKPFDVVDSIAKSIYDDHDNICTYIYESKRYSDEILKFWGVKKSIFRPELGLKILNFGEKFDSVCCGISVSSSESFSVFKGENEWCLTDKMEPRSAWFDSEDKATKNMYNFMPFNSYHPIFENTNYLKIGEEVEIKVWDYFKIGDVFNTGISNVNNIVIVTFGSGVWVYKYNSGVIPTATYDNGIYKFNAISGCTRFNLSDLIDTNQDTKTTLNYTSSTGGYSVDLSSEELNVATCDICDTNGNIVFAKNANIEDYVS